MSAEISMPSDTPGRSKEKPKKKPNQTELKFFAWAPRKVNCCSLFKSARKKTKKKKNETQDDTKNLSNICFRWNGDDNKRRSQFAARKIRGGKKKKNQRTLRAGLEKMTGKSQANCLLFHNWEPREARTSPNTPTIRLLTSRSPLSTHFPPHFSCRRHRVRLPGAAV